MLYLIHQLTKIGKPHLKHFTFMAQNMLNRRKSPILKVFSMSVFFLTVEMLLLKKKFSMILNAAKRLKQFVVGWTTMITTKECYRWLLQFQKTFLNTIAGYIHISCTVIICLLIIVKQSRCVQAISTVYFKQESQPNLEAIIHVNGIW